MRPPVRALALALLLPLAALSQGAPEPAPATVAAQEGVPVQLEGRELFAVRAPLGPFSAEQRAETSAQQLSALVRDPFFRPEAVESVESELGTSARYRGEVLFTVCEADAVAEGVTREQLFASRLSIALEALRQARGRHSLWSTTKDVLLTLLGLALLAAAGWGIWRLLLWVQGWFLRRFSARMEALGLRTYVKVLPGLFFLLRWAAALGLLLLALPLVFRLFPGTQGVATLLGRYVFTPLAVMGRAALSFIPDLVVLLLIAAATHAVLLVLHTLFAQAQEGKRTLPGVPTHWAKPIFNLTRLALIALAVVVAYPYIPGSGSPAFKGLTLFLGALVTFGASSAVSTFLYGLLLIGTSPFKVGDRVRAAGVEGDVLEMTLFITRIRTIKNELVTVPNSAVLSGPVHNFSALAAGPGLILHTEVTIGYDAPWRDVHAQLLEAARRTEGLLADPPPFVLQTALNDFYVTYQLNATTRQPARMAQLYADLHRNIQDTFGEAGMEIMSPHFSALRDGNAIALPPAARPEGYQPPRFRLDRE